jgi:hypothetical protein
MYAICNKLDHIPVYMNLSTNIPHSQKSLLQICDFGHFQEREVLSAKIAFYQLWRSDNLCFEVIFLELCNENATL